MCHDALGPLVVHCSRPQFTLECLWVSLVCVYIHIYYKRDICGSALEKAMLLCLVMCQGDD